jgi:YHS domain-containing protein
MILDLIYEFLLPLLIFLFLRAVLRNLFAGSRPSPRRASTAPPRPPAHAGGVLYKDPVCGVYVTAESGIAETIDGRMVHFCSQECRDRYQAG